MQTNKTYFPTVGISTASLAGGDGLFGLFRKKHRPIDEGILTSRQIEMRRVLLEHSDGVDSVNIVE